MTEDEEIPLLSIWQRVEQALSTPFGCCRFVHGEHQIGARVERSKALKYVVMVYVDGEWKGEWVKNPPEHVKPFMRAVKHYVWDKKTRAAYATAKGEKRRILQSVYGDINKQIRLFHPDWHSPKAFVRQLRKIADLRVAAIRGA